MAGTATGRAPSTTGLEPGLFRILRMMTVAQVIATPLFRRLASHSLGLDVPLARFFLITMPVPLLLVALTWMPMWERRLGRALLPLVLVIESANLLGDKFVTLAWLDSPANQELDGLLLGMRLWFLFSCVVWLVAFQYLWRPAVVSAVVLSAADLPLSLPFARHDSPLFPMFVLLFTTRTAALIVFAGSIGWLEQRHREQTAALAEANRKLAHYAATTEQLTVSRERNRLARELHDTLAHSLSAVTVQLEGIQALWDINLQSARTMLGSALQNARSGLTEARRALHALRASPLDDVGLGAALGDLARSAAARANLQLVLNAPPNGLGLRSEQEQFLYRVAQEATSNVVRHAHATELRVTLERSNGHLVLTVADNGVGFDSAAVDVRAHFGLKGIQERVELSGGELSVESSRGGGTTVRVALPVESGS